METYYPIANALAPKIDTAPPVTAVSAVSIRFAWAFVQPPLELAEE